MKKANLIRFVLLSLALAELAACKHKFPPTPRPAQARNRHIGHTSFYLASFDFGQVKAPKTTMVTSIPAMLLTELKDIGRFNIFDGGNIRIGDGKEPINETTAKNHNIDGYLTGTITGVTSSQVCFDARLVNANNHEVLYAQSSCVNYRGQLATGSPDRSGIRRFAQDVSRAIKKVSHAKVLSADGQVVFISKGKSAGVIRGMDAYIVATGDSVATASIHQTVEEQTGVDPGALSTSKAPVVVGHIYVIEVHKDYCLGWLYRGDYALPGDTVYFK